MATPIKLLKDQNLYLNRTDYQLVIMRKDSIDKRNGRIRYDSIRFYNSLNEMLQDLYKTFFLLRTPLKNNQSVTKISEYKKLHNQANKLLEEAMDNIKKAKNKEEIIHDFY